MNIVKSLAVTNASFNVSDSAVTNAVDNKRNLHYSRYDRDSDCSRATGGWRVFNLDTKKESVISRLKISDKTLMTPKRDKVVAEVEY
ncbi:MAG: hypothetical protein WCK89_23730 [bacterium]